MKQSILPYSNRRGFHVIHEKTKNTNISGQNVPTTIYPQFPTISVCLMLVVRKHQQKNDRKPLRHIPVQPLQPQVLPVHITTHHLITLTPIITTTIRAGRATINSHSTTEETGTHTTLTADTGATVSTRLRGTEGTQAMIIAVIIR